MTPLTGLIGMGGGATSHRFYTASSEESYQIEKSLRWSNGDSPRLTRTPSSAGDTTCWTLSAWLKLASFDSYDAVFSAGSSPTWDLAINDGVIQFGGNQTYRATNRKLRDPSAWYHVIWAFDSDHVIADSRMRIFVNGQEETSFATNATISSGMTTDINANAIEQNLGRTNNGYYFDGLISNVHFIDGLQLSPAAFGSFDSTGVWNPKEFALPTPNDGTTWSSGTKTGTVHGSGDDQTEAFNTDLTDAWLAGANDTSTLTLPNKVKINHTLEILTQKDSGANDYGVKPTLENAGQITDIEPSTTGSGEWVTYWTSSGTPDYLTALQCDSTSSNPPARNSIRAVRIDGVILIDGQTDETYTEWAASTSYNINSVHLKFNDTSSNAALGTDSLLSNDFTVTNLTATDSNNPENIDSLFDTPTNYEDDNGGIHANYATLNPLQKEYSDLSQGNLFGGNTSNADGTAYATIRCPSSGVWYCEVTFEEWTAGGNNIGIGVDTAQNRGSGSDLRAFSNTDSKSRLAGFNDTYMFKCDGSGGGTNIGTLTLAQGDVWQCCYDVDNGKLYYGKNNTWYTDAGPGSGAAFDASNHFYSETFLQDGGFFYLNGFDATGWINFGQRAWKYTPPLSAKALCTQNLDNLFDGEDSENNPSSYFDIKTYTGNGGTNSVKDVGFQPELVWVKSRSNAWDHLLFDRVRSDAGNIYDYLATNGAGAQATGGTTALTAYNSDGFTMGADAAMNTSNATFVAWMWDAGTTSWSSSDNDVNAGSFASSGYTNRTAGFSIVTYEGDQANNTTGTIGHNLGVAPEFIIVKNYDNSSRKWLVGHKDIASGAWTHHLYLDDDDPETGSSAARWNNTPPTQDVFSVGDTVYANETGNSYIAYCWAPIAGYSSFGSYTGNASATGPFVYTGFDTKWLMIKRIDATKGWMMIDSTRNPYNLVRGTLYPHANYAEHTGTGHGIDLLSNGFKIREDNDRHNASGGEYVYMAFAEHPFKVSRAR